MARHSHLHRWSNIELFVPPWLKANSANFEMRFRLFVLFIAPAWAATCYLPNGTSSDAIPCTNDEVTHCCNSGDYCLSNGLCFNAGGNNMMSVQGCTDKNWPQPCLKLCTNMGELSNGPSRKEVSSNRALWRRVQDWNLASDLP